MAAGQKFVKLKLHSRINKLCLFIVFILILFVIPSIEVSDDEFVKDAEQDGHGEGFETTAYECSSFVHVTALNVTPLVFPNKLITYLSYDKSAFESRTFRIMLFDGSGLPDCFNVNKALQERQPLFTTSTIITFEDLDPGQYCMKVQYCLSRMYCCDKHVYYTHTVTVPGAANETFVVKNPMQSIEEGESSIDILYIVLGVAIPLTLIGIIVLLWCRRKEEPLLFHYLNRGPERMQLFAAISRKPAVPVFILYYPDCDHHVATIHELANFLGRNNCQVSYDAVEKPEMAVNKVGWIAEKLSGNYKILVVNSRKAFTLQQEWLQNKKSNRDEGSEVFRSALAVISHRSKQAFDYQRLFMLRPSNVSKQHVLRDICPGKLYDVPGDLQDLLCHLHDLDPQSVDFGEREKSPASCDALERLIDSMTDYDDGGNLSSGCRRCCNSTRHEEFLPRTDKSHNLIDV